MPSNCAMIAVTHAQHLDFNDHRTGLNLFLFTFFFTLHLYCPTPIHISRYSLDRLHRLYPCSIRAPIVRLALYITVRRYHYSLSSSCLVRGITLTVTWIQRTV